MLTLAAKSARFATPSEAVSPASRALIAASSFGNAKASIVAAAPEAAPPGLPPCFCAATIALLMARFRYASVRCEPSCPDWLRAMRSTAYSFQRIVAVGEAHGLGLAAVGVSVAPPRCAQPPASDVASSAIAITPDRRCEANLDRPNLPTMFRCTWISCSLRLRHAWIASRQRALREVLFAAIRLESGRLQSGVNIVCTVTHDGKRHTEIDLDQFATYDCPLLPKAVLSK